MPEPTVVPSRGVLQRFRQLLVPAPMTRVGMFFLAHDAPAVVSVLARMGTCQIDRAPTELKDYLGTYFPERFREAFYRLRRLHEPLARRWGLTQITSPDPRPPRVPNVEEIERLGEQLQAVMDQVDAISRAGRQARGRKTELEHFDHYLSVLEDLDIDLEALADLRFLHLRVGTVPAENVDRLRESAALGEDLVLDIGSKGDRTQVLVVGAGGISADLEGLLLKGHFEPLDSGSSIRLDPDAVPERLETTSAGIDLELAEFEGRERELESRHRALVIEAGSLLARAQVFADCEGALEGRLPVAFLGGWIPSHRIEELKRGLREEVDNPVALSEQSASAGIEEDAPPTATMVPRVFRSGTALVSLYGTPGYDEIDPTLVLAMTTPLFFGMMFGDVGFGLLLVIIALAGGRYLGKWVPPIVACGLSSSVFGLLYGSVLGVEHWIPALWLHPMEEPFRLLKVALWIGVGFVLVTFALKAVSLLRQGQVGGALLGFSGGGGAVFYIGAVFVVRAAYLETPLPPWALALATAGLMLTLVNGALEIRHHGRAVLAELATEYFHGMLNLFANTLSFLRLAAFALAHSALSTALFMIVGTIPPTAAGWVARVLSLLVGGGVILALDILAVGVQTVRLQFYEGLARYYRGDGRQYRPLRFADDNNRVDYQTP